mmetsp:Transcript_23686/g.42893  ORF Transcript_23686/g.42893 Transcript_23686/m.42893 type:complete len:292 (-) Transcript_23686:42-917(-)
MFSPSSPTRIVSYFGISIVLAIYFAEWYAYHAIITDASIRSVLVFNALLFLAVWSHLQTAFTDPGTPASTEWEAWAVTRRGSRSEDEWRKECEELYANEENDFRLTPLPGKPSWCKKCRHERPERAHHCSTCGVCILRMDHHCPWIVNCIGWRNHKYFLLMTWWTFFACLAFLWALFHSGSFKNVSMEVAVMSFGAVVAVMAVVVFLLLSGFIFVLSLHAGMRNYTSLEHQFSGGHNPYCHASSLRNLEQIMGPLDVRWLFPVPCETRPGDGTSYDLVVASDAKDGTYGSV